MTILLLIISIISGCMGEKSVLQPLEEGKGKLKVIAHDEKMFYQTFGNYFNMKFPHIEFEVISQKDLPNHETKNMSHWQITEKLIQKHKPDIIFFYDDKMFGEYAQAGKLYALDEIIAQEKFDIEGYMPGLIDMLRAKGNGKLYGLAAECYPQLLYYNRDLFKEYGIELPRNQMTWEEVFALSKRFTGLGNKQVYGLEQRYGDVDDVLLQIADTYSVKLLDPKGEKLLIQSDNWKRIIKMTVDAVRAKAIHFQPVNEQGRQEAQLFIEGKAALITGGMWWADELRAHAQYTKMKEINWDIVTMPIDPATPNESADVYLSTIYAITEQSQNKRAAWEFIKFMNDREMAKVIGKSGGMLPTRMQSLKDFYGRNTAPLYALRPKETTGNENQATYIYDFRRVFRPLLKSCLRQVIENKKTMDEALVELETKGQQMLLKVKAAEKIKKKS